MPWTNVASVAVVVAQQFNPTIIKEGWLQKRMILAEGDLRDGSIFTDFVVQVRTEQFHMLVLQEQLQFVPSVPLAQQQQLIVEKLGALIQQLPETPYTALGLNFVWHLTAADGNTTPRARELFWRGGNPLYERFGAPDASFGAYLSKDVAGFRLKLDIKPVTAPGEDRTRHLLQFAFNFHHDVTGDDRAPAVVERLHHWDAARREAEEIIDAVEQRQQ
jgi:hypothetical protein